VVPSPALLKVIIESAILSDDQIVECCRRAEAAGADYVKTSTGFHAAGGAGEHAVRLMADTVGGRLGVQGQRGDSDDPGCADHDRGRGHTNRYIVDGCDSLRLTTLTVRSAPP
jgi:hypothetical protein